MLGPIVLFLQLMEIYDEWEPRVGHGRGGCWGGIGGAGWGIDLAS